MNIIELRYLRNGFYKEKIRVISDVPFKQGENSKAYLRRIIEAGNITDVLIQKIGKMKDKGLST